VLAVIRETAIRRRLVRFRNTCIQCGWSERPAQCVADSDILGLQSVVQLHRR
jgi:hypothetical protein